MKKSTFVATLLGTISGLFFAMGMCMTLQPEWNVLRPGVIVGCVGVVFALITVFIWRKMEHKDPIKINGKTIITVIVGIAGALLLGVGMCQIMIWSHMVIGIVGIAVLLCLDSIVCWIEITYSWGSVITLILKRDFDRG